MKPAKGRKTHSIGVLFPDWAQVRPSHLRPFGFIDGIVLCIGF